MEPVWNGNNAHYTTGGESSMKGGAAGWYLGPATEKFVVPTTVPINDALSAEMWSMFELNRQTKETLDKKLELFAYMNRLVMQRNISKHGLRIVGSTLSGFGSNSSDVDICLVIRGVDDVNQKQEAVMKLQEILNVLERISIIVKPEIIFAKVPILKFRDDCRHLDVDVNCNNLVGIRNTQLLNCYAQLDYRVKPLVLVLKLWAQFHGINDARNKTISSYSLVLMVIHFLQCGINPAVLPCLSKMYPEKFNNSLDISLVSIDHTVAPWQSGNTQSLGSLLLEFLNYYVKFNFTRDAVSVRLGSTIPIWECMNSNSVKNDAHQWKFLCVEEPFDLSNTARSVYDRDTFQLIRSVFYESWQRLLNNPRLEAIFVQLYPVFSHPRLFLSDKGTFIKSS